jgi:hypothetical protein
MMVFPVEKQTISDELECAEEMEMSINMTMRILSGKRMKPLGLPTGEQ